MVAMLHTGSARLAASLGMCSRLPVREAVSNDLLCDGFVYVPAPRTHMIVNPDTRLTASDALPVRGFRPSADWLFESASASFRERHIAVVLSGMMSDGAHRLSVVKRLGGTVVVQSPDEAAYPNMPAAAIATGCADFVLPIDAMSDVISDTVERLTRSFDLQLWECPFVA